MEIYKPLRHQVYGTQQIIDLPQTGPFLDMGLGKTVMTLTAIIELFRLKKIKRVLVIAPKKVAENVWTDEIEKWEHLKGLKTSQILGNEKSRIKALATPADIYITNRENVVWLVARYGSNWPFDMMVIDELSSFKSPKSQRFKSLRLVRRFVKRAVGLTGTPAPNGLLDLWSQLYLLDQGKRLGESFTKYRETYFEPGKRNGHIIFSYSLKDGDAVLGKEFYRKEIFNNISDICFSMKTEDYMDLPDRIDNNQYIILPKETQQRYDDFEKEQVLAFADKEITAINAAGLTNKLLQFANGAVYDEKKNWHIVHEEKMDKLEEIIEALNDEPLMVFYSFISDKERIMLKFKYARELKTPQDIKDWNNKKIKLLVAHPASAGHGLNLQFGGHNILWFGCPWSLELYQQAIKRIHRNGVTNVVNNMRLIVKNTIDEDVIDRLNSKDILQDAVIHAVKARIEKYSKIA
jgi:SNF2 family DNA or RNA helicase